MSKNLLMIPARVAIALQADGWILRADVIWHTPNAMPESVTDRPTLDYEHVFLLAKSARYFYDADAIREPLAESTVKIHSSPNVNPYGSGADWKQFSVGNGHSGLTNGNLRDGQRNKRSVWSIPTQHFRGEHFAVMPEKLVEPCVLAGCPETCCAVCGAPYVRVTERKAERVNQKEGAAQALRSSGAQTGGTERVTPSVTQYVSRTSLGFTPTCSCDGGTRPGVVLDPFGGAATVGIVARRLKREFLLIELNPKYVEIANERLSEPYQLNVF